MQTKSHRKFSGINSAVLASFSWILYDFANTIYSMNVVTMYFSLWVTVNLARADLWVSVSNSLSMALVALSLPILGVFSDHHGRRLPYLWYLTLICILGTLLIGITGYFFAAGWYLLVPVLCFIVANYSYQGALVFYNALLPVIAEPKRLGKISGYGVGMGYVGAIIGLLLVMPFVQGEISFFNLHFKPLQRNWQIIGTIRPELFSTAENYCYLDSLVTPNDNYSYRLLPADRLVTLSSSPIKITSKDTVIITRQQPHRAVMVKMFKSKQQNTLSTPLTLQRQISGWGRLGSFIPSGLLFFVFAIPIFIFVHEPKVMATLPQRPNIKKAFQNVWISLSDTRRFPGVLRFLIAKFFYEEGIETTIIFMAVYAVKAIGFANEMIIPFFMITTTAAVLGAILFGFITDWLGAKRTLLIVIGGWIVCLVSIVLVQKAFWFWFIGSLIGIFMGSTWTSARPLLINLVPKEKLAEFFGLYALSGKAAAIIGPLIWGIVVAALAPYGDAVRYRAAVLALALLMAIGFSLLWKVPTKQSHESRQ